MTVGIQDQPRGNIQGMYMLLVNITPVSVAANTTAEQNFTVTGLLINDYVDVNGTSITNGVGIVNTRVSANNQLTIGFANTTAGALTPPAGNYQLVVWRASFQPVQSTLQ